MCVVCIVSFFALVFSFQALNLCFGINIIGWMLQYQLELIVRSGCNAILDVLTKCGIKFSIKHSMNNQNDRHFLSFLSFCVEKKKWLRQFISAENIFKKKQTNPKQRKRKRHKKSSHKRLVLLNDSGSSGAQTCLVKSVYWFLWLASSHFHCRSVVNLNNSIFVIFFFINFLFP